MPRVRIEYSLYDEKKDRKEMSEIEKAEYDNEIALIKLGHISAIFYFLSRIDFSAKEFEEDLSSEHLSLSLSAIGELGTALSDGCYGDVDQLAFAYKKEIERLK